MAKCRAVHQAGLGGWKETLLILNLKDWSSKQASARGSFYNNLNMEMSELICTIFMAEDRYLEDDFIFVNKLWQC